MNECAKKTTINLKDFKHLFIDITHTWYKNKLNKEYKKYLLVGIVQLNVTKAEQQQQQQ